MLGDARPEPNSVAALELDVAALRRDSAGTATRVHLNAAGSSVMPRSVVQALCAHHELESVEGGYDAGYLAEALIEQCYTALAQLIHAQPSEIAFVDSGSRAWAFGLSALPLPPGSKLLFADTEYQGNWLAAHWFAEQRGWQLEVVEQTGDPDEDVRRFIERLDANVALVSAAHVPSNNGLVAPVEQLGRALKEHAPHVFYLVDACQSIGQLPVDVTELQADLLVGTGRKYLRGPRGSAFLFASSRVAPQLRPVFLDTFSAQPETLVALTSARCFETWECTVAGKIGLGAAVRYLLELDQHAVHARIAALAAKLRQLLGDVTGVRVLDLSSPRFHAGLVTFSVAGQAPIALWHALSKRGFRLDTCPVRGTLLERRLPNLDSVLRASVHYYTTEEELETFVASVRDLAGRRT